MVHYVTHISVRFRDVHGPKIFGPARPGPQFRSHFTAQPGPRPL